MEAREVEPAGLRGVTKVIVHELLERAIRVRFCQRHVNTRQLRRCVVERLDGSEGVGIGRWVSGSNEGQVELIVEVRPDSSPSSIAQSVVVLIPRSEEFQE